MAKVPPLSRVPTATVEARRSPPECGWRGRGAACHTGREMDDRELEDLILRARGGDREAAELLARAYERRVRTQIRCRLASDLRARVDTDDVFQSTITASLEDLKGMEFRGERAFVAWLSTVAERRVLDTAKRHRAERRDVRRQRPLVSAQGVRADETSPVEAAIRDEVQRAMREVMSRLPDRDRRLIELRSYSGLSFREIAEQLGLPNRHVARTLYRTALRRAGEEFQVEEGQLEI